MPFRRVWWSLEAAKCNLSRLRHAASYYRRCFKWRRPKMMSVGLSISARNSVFSSRVSAPKQILKWSVKKTRLLRLINMPPVHLFCVRGKGRGEMWRQSPRWGNGTDGRPGCPSCSLQQCAQLRLWSHTAPALQHQSHGNQTAFSQEKNASTDGRIIEVFYHQATEIGFSPQSRLNFVAKHEGNIHGELSYSSVVAH